MGSVVVLAVVELMDIGVWPLPGSYHADRSGRAHVIGCLHFGRIAENPELVGQQPPLGACGGGYWPQLLGTLRPSHDGFQRGQFGCIQLVFHTMQTGEHGFVFVIVAFGAHAWGAGARVHDNAGALTA